MLPKTLVTKVISGGQTGVDRAALDVGLQLGIPVSGYCPKGRLAEDGTISEKYPLIETESGDPAERTERNVLLADATLILSPGILSGGTKLTAELCEKHNKPHLIMEIARHHRVSLIVSWLTELCPQTLNVAGPKESLCPGIYGVSVDILTEVLRRRV